MEIFKLFGSIMIDNDKADKSISKTEKKAGGLGKKFGSVAKSVGKFGAVAAGAAAVAGGAMFALATKAGDAADRLLDLKAITGMSTTELQKWEKVSKVAGVSLDSMSNASQKLTKTLDTMSTGTGKAAESAQELGFSYDDLMNMNADERMDAITQALAGVEDKTKRAKLGTDLLGGSWKEIAPVVDMGTEAMKKAKDSANVVSEDDLNKANDFRIKIAELKDQFGHFAMMIGVKVAPVMTKFIDWIMQYMPQIKATAEVMFSAVSQGISLVIGWIGQLISWLKDWYNNNQETVDAIKNAVMEFVGVVVELFQSFVDLAMRIWEEYGDRIMNTISVVFELLKVIFQTAFDIIVDVFRIFAALFRGDWEGLWQAVKNFASNLWENLKKLIGASLDFIVNIVKFAWNLIGDILSGILGFIVGIVKKAWGWMSDLIQSRLQFIKETVSKIFGAIRDTIQNLSNKIRDTVSNVFGKVKDKMSEIFGGIKNTVLGIWDSLYGGIKGTINMISRAINKMIGGINELQFDIPDWVPKIGGKKFGINIPMIPMLAKGTDFFKGGQAIVGEEGPELVNLPRGSQVIPHRETMNQLSQGQSGTTIINHINVQGNIDKDLYDEIMRQQKNDFDTRLTVAGVRL